MEPKKDSAGLDPIVTTTLNYIKESKMAKTDRMLMNKKNFDSYHLKQDYSHKNKGQSQEFLPNQSMAVEQLVAFFQQALIDLGNWFRVERLPQSKDQDKVIKDSDIEAIVRRQLEKVDFMSFIGDALKSGFLGALMVIKVHGKTVESPRFVAYSDLEGGKKDKIRREDKKVWQLAVDLIRQADFHVDPTGKGLYRLQEIEMDLHEVEALSQGEDPLYDPAVVAQLSEMASDAERAAEVARETGQNVSSQGYRKVVKVIEGWGTILDANGKVLHKNVTWTIANDMHVLSKPKPNPFWHNRSPIMSVPIIRVPHAEWPKALMDAPTALNMANNELYNLIVDGGMMATHGIKQIHTDWLEDEGQVSNGVEIGSTLKVNSQCPPGAKVMERIDTASVARESLDVFNIMKSEFSASALTNDLRMGVMPSRQVKATEVVEASNTITSVFSGLAKVIESNLEKILELVWMTCAQNMDDLDSSEVKDLIPIERAGAIAQMTSAERFAATVGGFKFKVFGISQTMNKMKDFRKLTAMLQTIATDPVLAEEFQRKYDFTKLLEEIMRSLDIDTSKLELDQSEQEARAQASEMPPTGAPAPGAGDSPDMQSQIPQMASRETGGPLNDTVQSRIPRAHFPASPVSGVASK
jgi:hypothetical protein